ncbi:hypothetical protein C8A05DRAFT_45382 [Staphylotrichum tortipilum]|uniref:Outer spore wall protein RRT8 n=1 Tax=Staphylotrichum tortipilum TaxID=2831512 RepID=A0AAN6MHC3_9PEZI|nr:hypothetical protein C8A05DRAFT_45382 [Staphylotrichum longicolle]
MGNRLAERAQECSCCSKEDYDKARVLLNDAARSGSYWYPIKGIFYFAAHPALWKPLRSKLAPYLTLYSGVLGSMFFFTYLPQLAVMAVVNGPLAVFTTALLILNESSTITMTISKNYILRDAILDTFDGTLVARNSTEIVSQGRELKPRGDSIDRLGKALKAPFKKFSLNKLVRYVIYLPLNFIPVIGTVVFVVLRGRSRGDAVHDRYFQLKGWSKSTRSQWLKDHQGPYTAFGTVATLLEMIPLASVFFSFSNTVGAALWAADIEAKEVEMFKSTAPELRETAKKAE